MPALDHDALRARVAGQLSGARLEGLQRLPGGLSSLTFAARLVGDAGGPDVQDVVVKVAPPGLAPVHNRDVLRQARVLDALAGLDGFPVPAVLCRDPGDPPDVPPAVVMERAAGQAYEPLLDVAETPPTPDVAAERMRAAARALAALHTATPADLGLGDEPTVSLEQECDRWARLFATIDADVCPGHEELGRRLRERVPAPRPPRVHHGDYRVANMLFTDAALRAVIDWEIWSVGDPRFDLAWLAMHTAPGYAFHAERPPADLAAGAQVPDADEIVAEYLAADGADPGAEDDRGWFVAASRYKGASTVAALVKRERRRDDPDPQVMTVGRHLGAMLEAGHRALDRAA